MATTTEKQIVALEEQFWMALKDRDMPTATALTDFPCILTGPQGVGSIDKQSFAKMMEDARYTLDRFELNDVQVRLISDDVAIVAYKVHEELTVDGDAVTFDAVDSSTWIRRNGRWACAMHSEALIGDPFGRDRHS